MKMNVKIYPRRSGKTTRAVKTLRDNNYKTLLVTFSGLRVRGIIEDFELQHLERDIEYISHPLGISLMGYEEVIIDDADMFTVEHIENIKEGFAFWTHLKSITVYASESCELTRFFREKAQEMLDWEAKERHNEQTKESGEENNMNITVEGKGYKITSYMFAKNLTSEHLVLTPSGVEHFEEGMHGEYLVVVPIRWRAKKGGAYYYVTFRGHVKMALDDVSSFHRRNYEQGNYYKTRELAQEAVSKISKIFEENL